MTVAVETFSPAHSERLEAIDVARMVKDLERLSGAEFAGRRVGSAGHDRCRDWLAARLTHLGFDVTLRGGQVDADVIDLTAAPVLALVGKLLRYRTDFAEHQR